MNGLAPRRFHHPLEAGDRLGAAMRQQHKGVGVADGFDAIGDAGLVGQIGMAARDDADAAFRARH